MEESSEVGSNLESFFWLESLVNGLAGHIIRVKQCLYSGASPFQKIEVFDTYAYGRVLCLAGNIVLTEKDEHIYHEMIVHPALLMHKQPRRICIIGGGDGGCLREVIKHQSVKHVEVVEIDSQVKKVIENYFPSLSCSFSDPRVSVTFDDGFSYLEKCSVKYDVIIIDSYDPGGPVQSLETENFNELVCQSLAKGGIAVFQTDSPTVKPETLRKAIATSSALYPVFRPYLCCMPSFPESLCSFLICCKETTTIEKFNERAFKEIEGSCRYFNRQVYRGAFLLPQHVVELLTI